MSDAIVGVEHHKINIFVRQEEYYYTAQTIWQINVDRYMKAVDVFKSTSDIKFSFEDTLK